MYSNKGPHRVPTKESKAKSSKFNMSNTQTAIGSNNERYNRVVCPRTWMHSGSLGVTQLAHSVRACAWGGGRGEETDPSHKCASEAAMCPHDVKYQLRRKHSTICTRVSEGARAQDDVGGGIQTEAWGGGGRGGAAAATGSHAPCAC